MSKFILCGFLFTLIISISSVLSSYDNISGKICGTHPWTYRCPAHTQCGTYVNRLCYTESNGPTLIGIIFIVVISLFIFIMILKACITCYCSPRNNYHSLSPDPTYVSRSGAVVCTVATSHC